MKVVSDTLSHIQPIAGINNVLLDMSKAKDGKTISGMILILLQPKFAAKSSAGHEP